MALAGCAGRGWSRAAGFGRRRWKWLVIPVALIAVSLAALDRLLVEPLRLQMERRLNAVRIKDRQIAGYVKPLFRDMDVYDERQDRHKTLFRKLYEGVVGGMAKLLENAPRDEIATKTTVSGRMDSPSTSTAEVLVGLIRNAFFRAILPGFERELERIRRA